MSDFPLRASSRRSRVTRSIPQLGLNLFGDPGRSITDQVLKAYEYRDKWVNRMILGDSLVVMNSLLRYEGLGGQVQMIYIDPPYGVRFGSNFQPFVRKRDVSHNDDEDMTRTEMVRAYAILGNWASISYLTYLRDRLPARERTANRRVAVSSFKLAMRICITSENYWMRCLVRTISCPSFRS